MRAFYADHFVLPLPEGHTFPMAKYRLLREAVQASVPDIQITEAPPATDGELALAHEPAGVAPVHVGQADVEHHEVDLAGLRHERLHRADQPLFGVGPGRRRGGHGRRRPGKR